MTDVDAVRLLASEHNLEFVDLDAYSVDPSVASVLPRKVACKYQVVPIGRKFGAPVIAIGDPGDVMAIDTLRATIGREFISVVAPSEQIEQCIDRVYVNGADAPVADVGVARPGGRRDPSTPDPVSAALTDALDRTRPPGAPAGGSGLLPPPPLPPPPLSSLPNAGMGFLPVGAVPPPPVGVPPAPRAGTTQPAAAAPEGATVRGGASSPAPGPVFAEAATQTGSGSTRTVAPPRQEDPHRIAGPPVAPGLDLPPDGVPDGRVASKGSVLPPAISGGYRGGVGPGPAANPSPGSGPAAGSGSDPGPAANPSPGSHPAAGSGSDPGPALALDLGSDPGPALALDLGSDPGPAEPSPVDAVFDEAAADLVDEAVAQFEETAGTSGASASVSLDGDLADFPPLARVLVEGGRVPIDAMREALFEQDRTGQSLARTLTSMRLVTEADLMWGMASEMGLEFVDLDLAGVDLTSAYVLPEATARYHGVLVIGQSDGHPVVATANPTNVLAGDDLRTILGRHFSTVVATRSQINAFLDRAYSQGGNAAEVATSAAGDFAQDLGGEEIENIQAVVDDAPIVRYVNLLVLQAINERASDIHVEPTAENLRIRYRIDGVLHDMSTAPRSIAAAVTTRLKVMADLNIAEHRIPQDGRISLKIGTRGIDLRMATLPTIYGEKIVMRVLDKSNVVLSFEELGFEPELLERYRAVYAKPYGTILVTGPTGSGKTTTMYATLAALNSPEKNIITVEDPVELRIKGINQVQLNIKAGLTFASALRSILRADPDIVLVGEIRDRETALISVEAALTGHLVLATLHTNDAASTPMRLVEMGLEPYLVSTAASAVVAQRLARRLCTHCREMFEPTEAEIVAAGWRLDELLEAGSTPKLYRAIGCSACSHTGYRGRKALAELLVVTEEVEHMIVEGGSADDIHRLAVEQGMVTLRQSGLRRALEGATTLEEVLRVVA